MDIAPDYPNIIDRIKAHNAIAGMGYDCWEDDNDRFLHVTNESENYCFENYREAYEHFSLSAEYMNTKKMVV